MMPPRSICCLLLFVLLSTTACAQEPPAYQANWESLNQRETPDWFQDAKFGIFIHWGVYSVPAWSVRGQYSEWYWRRIMTQETWREFHDEQYGDDFEYAEFAPMFKAELFDPDEWAAIFADAGARYVVLTSKHHDGFCLWPSKDANRTWGRPWNSFDVGPQIDLVGELTHAVHQTDMKMGLYFSLYEWYNPLWQEDRKRYAVEHMHPQFKDVVTRYQPSLIFSDGEWDMPSSDWRSPELLAWLFNESPVRESVVINDRWGKDERHKNGGYWTTEYGAGLPGGGHPWEECRGIAHSFGYSRTERLEDYKPAKELVWILADLVSRGGNLLLDVGPTADGRIPVIMHDRLARIGRWLRVNGEAIYETRPHDRVCQWSDGEEPQQGYKNYREKYDIMKLAGMTPLEGKARKQAFFTTKPGVLFAILPEWPGRTFRLSRVQPTENTKVSMLGVEGTLDARVEGDDLIVTMPEIAVDKLPCEYAWTLRVTALETIR